jgi:ABC-type ATPase with predicted acetyltransferase domain
MLNVELTKEFKWDQKITERIASVMRLFGLTVEKLRSRSRIHCCELTIAPADVIFLTGPSGAGKSVLLRELENMVPAKDRINLNSIELPGDKAVIDCFNGDILQSLRTLNTAGLSDCFSAINTPALLSDGQKYRFRLAMALEKKPKFIFADEFCSNLDRITASVIAWKINRFAKKHNVTFVLAASSDDFLADLAPDILVIKELGAPANVIYKDKNRNRK